MHARAHTHTHTHTHAHTDTRSVIPDLLARHFHILKMCKLPLHELCMETIPVSRHVQGHQEWVYVPHEKILGLLQQGQTS